MLAVNLTGKIERRLSSLSKKTGKTEEYYVQKAVETLLEDEEDYLQAIARLKERNPRFSLAQVKRLIDLAD